MTRQKGIKSYTIVKANKGISKKVDDVVAVEEPLEIRLAYYQGREVMQKSIAVTMRTPGEDIDLALGFLVSEGVISNKEVIVKATYLPHKSKQSKENRLLIGLHPSVDFDIKRLERHFYTSSSCGVCGKSSVEAVQTQCNFDLLDNDFTVNANVIQALPERLKAKQGLFDKTGGIHAAGIFDENGKLLLLREDVGRHNAVDKVIGAALRLDKLPLSEMVLQVSGRASFELVQKALTAGIPVLSAVGAPSSLAVDLARANGMTLLGFVRNEKFNIYAGAKRIIE